MKIKKKNKIKKIYFEIIKLFYFEINKFILLCLNNNNTFK